MVPLTTIFQSMPEVARIINDNQCKDPQDRLELNMMGQNKSSQNISKTVYSRTAVIHVPIVVGPRQPQKKGLTPDLCQTEIKHAKSVSFVSPCLSVPPVPNVPNVADSPPVGGRLQRLWEIWLSLGSNPRVISILKEGYNLPFKMRPPLTKSSQEQLLEGGFAIPDYKTGGRESSGSVLSCLLQPAVHNSQTAQQMASHLGFEQSFPPVRDFQNGNSRDNQTFPSTAGVGHIARLQRCLFPHPHQSEVEKVCQVSFKQSNLPVHGSAVQPSDGSFGVYKGCEGGKTDGPGQGYKDPPVLRQLVTSGPLSGDLFRPNPDPDGFVPKVRVGGQFEKVGTCSPTGVQLCRLSFRPLPAPSKTHSGEVASPDSEDKDAHDQRRLFCPPVHASHRVTDSHRETGGFGSPSHETDSVAPEESLASLISDLFTLTCSDG